MKYKIIIVKLLFAYLLSALPIMTNVTVRYNENVIINGKIDNPEKGMEIEIGCYKISDKKITTFQFVSGDYGKIGEKEQFRIVISHLPQNFVFTDYIIFPKLIFNDKIYYEMEKVSGDSYVISYKNNIIEPINENSFYISKFEVTNEQYLCFVNADGYEFEEYWEVDPTLMSKTNIGWLYQAKYKMSLPIGWLFKNTPFFKEAESNFVYGPVTNVRWFEANAFCNWMGGTMPTERQYKIVFSRSDEKNDNLFAGISEFRNRVFPIQHIKDGVSEWMMSGVDPTSAACGGCNEMYILKNNAKQTEKSVFKLLKCPLYRETDVGLRLIIKK